MIIVDNALRAREAAGGPIRVGMIGAGFMAQGLANQIANSVPGMRRRGGLRPQAERGGGGLRATPGAEDSVVVDDPAEFEDALRSGRRSVTEDPLLLARSEQHRRARGC